MKHLMDSCSFFEHDNNNTDCRLSPSSSPHFTLFDKNNDNNDIIFNICEAAIGEESKKHPQMLILAANHSQSASLFPSLSPEKDPTVTAAC